MTKKGDTYTVYRLSRSNPDQKTELGTFKLKRNGEIDAKIRNGTFGSEVRRGYQFGPKKFFLKDGEKFLRVMEHVLKSRRMYEIQVS